MTQPTLKDDLKEIIKRFDDATKLNWFNCGIDPNALCVNLRDALTAIDSRLCAIEEKMKEKETP